MRENRIDAVIIQCTMEKENIAYFYLLQGETAKISLLKKAVLPKYYVEKDRLRICAIGIPEFYAKRMGQPKTWKKEKLWKMLNGALEECRAEQIFLQEASTDFLKQEKIMPPAVLMETMLSRVGMKENLILVGSPNSFFDTIFEQFMKKVNYLQIVCKQEEEYEQEREWLYETYGIVTVFQGNGGGTPKQDTLVIDMEQGGKNGRPVVELKSLSKGTVYVDMCSERQKRLWITKKRSDIHYLSPESLLNKWCRLDTTVQNGYNTRVKMDKS